MLNGIIPPLAIFGIGMPELVLILLIIVILFGAKRLPEIARALGKSLREFKKGTKSFEDGFKKATRPEEDNKKEKKSEHKKKSG